MTEKLAEEIINAINKYRQAGVVDDVELFNKLQHDYPEQDIDYSLFLELMNTGVFRASFVMKYGKYPANNLDNDVVIKVAFKLYWIEQRGKADYDKLFATKKKKWWQFR